MATFYLARLIKYRSGIMKRTVMCLLTLLLLSATPALSQDAIDYFNLGLKNSRTRKKIEYFTKALEMDPRLTTAYEKRGMLYYFQGKYEESIQDYETYLDLTRGDAQAYRMLGMCYLKSGIYEPAIASFTRVIEMEPERATAYAYRAEAYRLSGRGEEALRDATPAIKLRGDPRAKSDAYRTRAKLHWAAGRKELGSADFSSSWQIDPRVPRWWRVDLLNFASAEELSNVAPFIIIALVFVLIFGLRLKPPEKNK